tara:strand:- start:417 stop:821 length:405 start_codon:yes stop_codon:yes gene_type:complete
MYSVSGKYNNKKLIETMDLLNKKMGKFGGSGVGMSTVQSLINKHTGSNSKMASHIGEVEKSDDNKYIKSNESVKQTDVDPNQSVSVVNKESITANMSNRKKIPKTESEGGGISFNIIIVVIILVSLLMCLKESN